MPKTRPPGDEEVKELLQKMLVVQLHSMGATQDKIAKTVGRQKLWVNRTTEGVSQEAD